MKEHELRKRIKREKIQEQMPESTRKRMDDLLDGLPEETKRSKINRIWKNAVVFVAVLSLSTPMEISLYPIFLISSIIKSTRIPPIPLFRYSGFTIKRERYIL